MFRKLMKTAVALALMLCVVFGSAVMAVPEKGLSFGLRAYAANSGKCGENLTWTLSNGTLTISGTGAMYNYAHTYKYGSYYYSSAPWIRSTVKKVIIDSRVTSIGDYAFCTRYFSNSGSDDHTGGWSRNDSYMVFTSIEIPDSVTSIGVYAFDHCVELSSVSIPSNRVEFG